MMKEDLLSQKLIAALSQTKFKTDMSKAKMYYYGTEAEANSFVNELKKCVASKKEGL